MVKSRLFVLSVAAVAATSCQARLDLDVTMVEGVPHFTIEDGRGACVKQVSVYKEGPPSPTYVWSIVTEAACADLREIGYAKRVVGFEVFDGPETLVPGQEYTVRVDAPGKDGLSRFVAP